MHALSRKSALITEFTVFIIGLPLLLYWALPMRYLLPTIWGAALYCYVITRATKGQALDEGWGHKAVNWGNLKPILIRFAAIAAVMVLLTWQMRPDLLFNFVREKPAFWALVMVAYPLLSVVPQEVIFRNFFFMRYAPLFKKPLVMVLMSAAAFAFAHILFHNWVAPLLCLAGGLLFADTYRKTRSLALVAIEHALYGDLMFTVGLGRYFYHGTVAAALQQ